MRLFLIITVIIMFPGILMATVIPACPPGGGNVESNVEDGVEIDNGDCGILDASIGTISGNVEVKDGTLTINGDISEITGNIFVCSSCSLTINGNIDDMNGSITNEGTMVVAGNITAEGKLEIKGGGNITLDGGTFESTGDGVVIESGATMHMTNGSSIIASSGTENEGVITSDGKGNSFSGGITGGGDHGPFDPCPGSCTDNSGLPVELVDFYLDCEETGIHFYWQTASELNNSYFTLQHSPDGFSWTEIAQVDGHGTTNNTTNYSHETTQPLNSNYFRLVQTDFDGTSEIHPSIYSSCATSKINAMPNPTTGNIKINLGNTYSNITLEVVNVFGRVVFKEQYGKQSSIPLDLTCPKGLYFVRVSSPLLGTQVQRILKEE
ncbi:MAG: T9SS type A sorting domain-containing protein [Cyclobacteriaceae bacterium]